VLYRAVSGVCVASGALFFAVALASAQPPSATKADIEIGEIVRSTELSKQQKIERLAKYFSEERLQVRVLYCMAELDKAAAQKAGLELFRKPMATRDTKLRLGRCLARIGPPQEFAAEYARFLVQAVLDGGQEEFLARREDGSFSAVGEYAYIASGFEGHKADMFAGLKDPRVIPILIKCLDAPETVWPSEARSCMDGKPGESTGRNGERAHVPVALAKLGAVEAVPKLKEALFTHRDYWLRYHSAYALGRLMERKDSREIEKWLNEGKDARQFLFPFGEGLIARGELDGVKYLAFEHSAWAGKDTINSLTYMVEQRLPIVSGLQSQATEPFLRHALEYPPLRAVWLFDDEHAKYEPYLEWYEGGKLKRDASGQPMKVPNAEVALRQSEERIVAVFGKLLEGVRTNRLASLSGVVSDIGGKTKSARIQRLCQEHLKLTPGSLRKEP